jgi:hypothetical protein
MMSFSLTSSGMQEVKNYEFGLATGDTATISNFIVCSHS